MMLLKYLVDICQEIIIRLTCLAKKDIQTQLHLSLDTGSQLKTNLTLIALTSTWLRVTGYNS